MSKLREQWKLLRAQALALRDRAADGWSRLSQRDQQLVTILGTAAGIFLLGVTVFLAASHLSRLRHDIDTRAVLLTDIRDMRAEFKGAKERLDTITGRLRALTVPPRTFLEEKAGEVNIRASLDSMEERAAPPNEFFKAQLIEVRLKKVSLANLARFLHKIESAGAGMSVRSFDISTNFNDPKYLDVKVQIQALRPKE